MWAREVGGTKPTWRIIMRPRGPLGRGGLPWHGLPEKNRGGPIWAPKQCGHGCSEPRGGGGGGPNHSANGKRAGGTKALRGHMEEGEQRKTESLPRGSRKALIANPGKKKNAPSFGEEHEGVLRGEGKWQLGPGRGGGGGRTFRSFLEQSGEQSLGTGAAPRRGAQKGGHAGGGRGILVTPPQG